MKINLIGTYISETNDVRFDIIEYSCDSVNEMKCWGKSWGEMLWVILSNLLHDTCCGIRQTGHLQTNNQIKVTIHCGSL